MTDQEKGRIREAWLTLPAMVRRPPATEDEVIEFEALYGSIPLDFRWFLTECGGGPVGSEWVNSIADLPQSHSRFRSQFAKPGGWTLRDVFIIGWDGSGNPFGIHTPTGEVWVEDHNFGGIHRVAESFERFLAIGLIKPSQPA